MEKTNYIFKQLRECKSEEEQAELLNKTYELMEENFLGIQLITRFEKIGNLWYKRVKISGETQILEGTDMNDAIKSITDNEYYLNELMNS